MPKGSASSNVFDYRPISITPVLSKVFEKIVAGKSSHFLERNGMLPPSQFSYRRGLGTWDALLTLSHSAGCFGQGHEGKTCSVGLISCI